MHYNVSQLLKSHTGELRQYTLQEKLANVDADIHPLSDLTGNVAIIRTTEGVLVRASMRLTVELTCSRCLTEFGYPARFEIEEEFLPTVDVMTGAHLPKPEDADPATQIDEHHILDLTEIVRQELTLALPMVPVCRNNCAGLCPVCGKNQNETQCNHDDDDIDPRFAVLKDLLDESENNH